MSPEPWWGDPLAKHSAPSVPVAAFGNTTPAESFEAASRRGVLQFGSVLDRGLLHSEVMLVGRAQGGTFDITAPAESFEAANRRGVHQFGSALDRGLLHSEVMLVGRAQGGIQLSVFRAN